VKGMPVKQTRVRYPLEVVLQDVDPEHNPWGLALDGYGSEAPARLSEEEASQAFSRPPPKEQERARS
ncbi:MAG: DUF2895 family protein, partial [Anaerolineales bacterium]